MRSNSGPAWSSVSAMKPSSEMEAWAITFPMAAFPSIGLLLWLCVLYRGPFVKRVFRSALSRTTLQ
jgi:hypothetical protein